MENIAIAFGRAIRQLRKQKNLSQEELGFEADLQRIYVSKLELGQQQPSITTIFKLAKGLGCSATELIEKTEEELQQK
ncbi:helix-turn-helix transcriptional regulator [Mannheimia pernigra]|uniref:Helix-turn-helix transcriptional regulator n=1 Tax=Mannheimia pernigra TaxID=111844 RepID=A0ABD7A8N7_9PAST|nr:helix-turn-helix transcriptional regulator [Mannheimia pernigra]QLB42588.1 helix-turn-helix transcriptional regulator [Mannheimia pernigra]